MTLRLYGEQKSGNCPEVGWVLKKPDIPYCWVDNDILHCQNKAPLPTGLNYAGQVRVIGPDDRRPPDWTRATMTCVAGDRNLIPGDRYDRGATLKWLYSEHYNPEPGLVAAAPRGVMAAAPMEAPR
jgi:glutathione S-transferase